MTKSEQAQKDKFSVKEGRNIPFVQIETHVIKSWLRVLGPNTYAVYSALVAFMNYNSREAWPSMRTMGEMAGGLSRTTVKLSIDLLAAAGFIRVELGERRNGRWARNIYTILNAPEFTVEKALELDKVLWKEATGDAVRIRFMNGVRTRLKWAVDNLSPVPQSGHGETAPGTQSGHGPGTQSGHGPGTQSGHEQEEDQNKKKKEQEEGKTSSSDHISSSGAADDDDALVEALGRIGFDGGASWLRGKRVDRGLLSKWLEWFGGLPADQDVIRRPIGFLRAGVEKGEAPPALSKVKAGCPECGRSDFFIDGICLSCQNG